MPMDQRTDGELLAAWSGGDAGAFTELVQRHRAVCARHARALLGRGADVDDVVQDVFCTLSQSPPDLDPEVRGDAGRERAQLRGWLHRVTRNRAMDLLRGEARRRKREQEAAPPEAVGGGIETVEQEDTRAAVERGLERLPAPQREVLVLRLLAERSYREIAEITGRNVGTVGWLVSEGLRALGLELAPLLPAVAGDGLARGELRRTNS
jgi:RNA polymerase sigma-70 factor (ECF subfamily)